MVVNTATTQLWKLGAYRKVSSMPYALCLPIWNFEG